MARGFKSGGRAKGTPNKFTGILKEAVIEAANLAGDREGLIGYLQKQARENPGPFMALLGKVLPMQLAGDQANPIVIQEIKRLIVDPKTGDTDS